MKKVIYIDIDEEITSIYDRVKNLKQKTIYLVIPKKAIVFQSLVNLKILKSKFKELKKKLIVVTVDSTGRHLAEQLKIQVISRVEIGKIEAEKDESPQMQIQPIQARRNEVLKENPRRFTEKKMTIAELVKEFRLRDKDQKKRGKDSGYDWHSFRPNRKFLSLILIISVGLFGLITYIALPGATVYIRPTFDDIGHSVNIVLADRRKNQNLISQNQPHVIASEEINTITKQTKIFNTTSQEFQGENATGKLTIINTADETWELKGGTRFQTEEGLIFRIVAGVTVPRATQNEAGEWQPGQLEASIVADPFDIYSNPIGDRGNIEPTRFIIPGLSKYNQRRIWAESKTPTTGGITKYHKVVMAEDIEAAKKQIQDNLILTAKEELHAYLKSKNKLNHSNWVLLDDRRYVTTELLDLRISDDLEGSTKDKFEVFAKIKAQGVAYDFDQVFNLLKKELSERTHPSRRIRPESIQPESISYEVIEGEGILGQIKITASIKGIEEFIIDPQEEVGYNFGNKLKEGVLGLPVEEAEKIINNFPEVDTVQIKTWPIWISKMPRIPENIEIKLLK